MFFGTEFILISLISLSVTSTKRLAAILKISVLLYSPVGEKNTSILTSTCRICYVHLCKNTNERYSPCSCNVSTLAKLATFQDAYLHRNYRIGSYNIFLICTACFFASQ